MKHPKLIREIKQINQIRIKNNLEVELFYQRLKMEIKIKNLRVVVEIKKDETKIIINNITKKYFVHPLKFFLGI